MMEITRRQTELVRSTFAQIAPMAEAAGTLFYNRLFELDPALKSLFRGDMIQQKRKLMQMLGVVVAWLDRPRVLALVLEGLGSRHTLYGVKRQHYDTVGQALISTLGEALGERFNAEVREAWITAYRFISSSMLRVAEEVAAV